MLPKLNHPTFETTIPSTGAAVKYRPFLVREHKMLMKAVEFNDDTNLIETFKTLVHECTFKTLDVATMPMFDVEYLFLKIKACSTGSNNAVRYTCENVVDGVKCGQSVILNIDTEQTKVEVPNKDTLVIMLDDKGTGVRMRYPSFEDYVKHTKVKSLSELSSEFTLDCVDVVFDSTTVYVPGKDFTRDELRVFMDDIGDESAEKIAQFIENIPQIELHTKIKCPKCGNESEIHLVGLDDFLE